MKLPLFLAIVSLYGCASNSGVVNIGENRYMVIRQAATGFSGTGTLKADAVAEAGARCGEKGITILETNESRPPYVLGNFPRVEIQFSCN